MNDFLLFMKNPARNTLGKTVSCLLVLLFHCLVVHADSDGYYCAGDNFIAYDFFDNGHTLYVIPFESPLPDSAIALQISVAQVHSIKCSHSTIVIADWDSLYTYTFSAGKLSLSSVIAHSAPGAIPNGGYGSNLGRLSPVNSGRIPKTYNEPLMEAEDGKQFELNIRRKDIGECEAIIRTMLYANNRNGKAIDSLQIFNSKVSTECAN